MLIRRFEAASAAAALAKVREAFGPEALVLSTTPVDRGRRWFGVGSRPTVEVTAAIDRDHLQPTESGRGERVASDSSWRPLQISRAVVEPLEAEIRLLRERVEALDSGGAPAPSLMHEIAQLRQLAATLSPSVDSQDSVLQPYRVCGLAESHVSSLAVAVRERIARGEDHEGALVECLAERVEARLAPPRSDEPRVQMLVGAPGVGKTTTLAKIAARTWGLAPCIVTTDVHRIGSDAFLRAFAERIDAPFEIASDEDTLVRVATRHPNRRLLVDTRGGSRCDGATLSELRRFRARLGGDANVQLVVSATTKESDLRAQVEQFRPLEPSSLVMCKVDDSNEIGNVLNVLLAPDTPPLARIGNGQRIPEDLDVPEARSLAMQFMGATA